MNGYLSAPEGRPPFAQRSTEQLLDYYSSSYAGNGAINDSSDDPSRNGNGGHGTYEGSYNATHNNNRHQAGDNHRNRNGSQVEFDREGYHRHSSSVKTVRMDNSGSVEGSEERGESTHRRRLSDKSASYAADNRRLHIMEVDRSPDSLSPATERTQSAVESEMARNAQLGISSSHGQSRVALVAPPDASPASYTNLRRSHSSLAMEDQRSGAYVTSKPSKRSMTYDDTAYHNQRATLDKQPSSHSVRSFAPSQTYSNYNYRSTTPPPIVIPGPSPPAAGVIIPAGQAGLGPQWAEMGNGQILTPMIGESKDIGSPVAGPVIVNLGSGWTTAASSQVYVASPIGMMSPPRLYPSPPEAQLPFLFYDPVRDSTAGPPPSPPRAIFDEPLPGTSSSTSAAAPTATRHLRHSSLRRSNEVKNEYLKPGNHIGSMKAGAESDYSINAISASSSDMGHNENAPPLPYGGSVHVREGAFPRDSMFVAQSQALLPPAPPAPPTPDPAPYAPPSSPVMGPPNAYQQVVASVGHEHREPEPEQSHINRSRSAVELRRDDSSDSVWDTPSQAPSRDRSLNSSTDLNHVTSRSPPEKSPAIVEGSRGPPPSERRFSTMPRSASMHSHNMHSVSAHGSQFDHKPLPTKLPKVKWTPGRWPEAMSFQDVLVKKTPLERAIAYAIKINDLACEESGLEAWVFHVRNRSVINTPEPEVPMSPTMSTMSHPGLTRHFSRRSIASEATFPVRPDASVATNLTPIARSESPPSGPPNNIPYPMLAQGMGVRSNSGKSFGLSSSSSTRSGRSSKSAGGFFASIGRINSIRKDRTPPSKNNSFTRLPTAQEHHEPRPVQIQAAPTIPGGPRAAPPSSRSTRANSLLAPSASGRESKSSTRPASMLKPSASPERQNSGKAGLIARSSLTYRNPNSSSENDSDTWFETSLDKLTDVLPHLPRSTLAHYLQKTGSDITAITAILEDEKKGKLPA